MKANSLSDQTINLYYYSVLKFLHFISEYYPSVTSIERITKAMLLDYQDFLTEYKTKKGTPYSNNTKKNRILSIKLFFRFLIKADYHTSKYS
jgi:site-specific recombinase XerD